MKTTNFVCKISVLKFCLGIVLLHFCIIAKNVMQICFANKCRKAITPAGQARAIANLWRVARMRGVFGGNRAWAWAFKQAPRGVRGAEPPLDRAAGGGGRVTSRGGYNIVPRLWMQKKPGFPGFSGMLARRDFAPPCGKLSGRVRRPSLCPWPCRFFWRPFSLFPAGFFPPPFQIHAAVLPAWRKGGWA